MPHTARLYMDYILLTVLFSYTAEEAEVQSNFSYIWRMKYHRTITTFDVQTSFFRDYIYVYIYICVLYSYNIYTYGFKNMT